MVNILVAGAGKSSTWLISYLLRHASREKWIITIADGNAAAINEKTGGYSAARNATFDITSEVERQRLVQQADIVVSLMPPHLHILLAKDCLEFSKHLITSSYISPEMKELDAAVRKSNLMFMCEMGLDPGIDHMTANQIIHSIQRVAGRLESFSSYCGGLIAPESDTNPWHYKFSWNPRNIIDAGKAGASYLKASKIENIGYNFIFQKNEIINTTGAGNLAWYPNRDSLKYLDVYEVPDATTFLRATLRHADFCAGWDALVRLGATSTESGPGEDVRTYAQWIQSLSGYDIGGSQSLQEHVVQKLRLKSKNKVVHMLEWLGLFEEAPLRAETGTHGDILLLLLEDKWAMLPEDKDMVVMQHEVGYTHRGRHSTLVSSMMLKGENRERSAMAKTVGLPMAILTKLVLGKKLRVPHGVLLPGMPAIYRPVLTELAHHGIVFKEEIR